MKMNKMFIKTLSIILVFIFVSQDVALAGRCEAVVPASKLSSKSFLKFVAEHAGKDGERYYMQAAALDLYLKERARLEGDKRRELSSLPAWIGDDFFSVVTRRGVELGNYIVFKVKFLGKSAELYFFKDIERITTDCDAGIVSEEHVKTAKERGYWFRVFEDKKDKEIKQLSALAGIMEELREEEGLKGYLDKIEGTHINYLRATLNIICDMGTDEKGKLNFLKVFRDIKKEEGLKGYLGSILEKDPLAFALSLRTILRIGMDNKSGRFKLLEVLGEIGFDYIGFYWRENQADFLLALEIIEEMGTDENGRLNTSKILNELKKEEFMADGIGPACKYDFLYFVKSMVRILKMGLHGEGQSKIMDLFSEIGMKYVRRGMRNRNVFCVLDSILEMGFGVGGDLFAALIVRELKKEKLLKDGIGQAWQNNPNSFAHALYLIKTMGVDSKGSLEALRILKELKKEKSLKECISIAWRNDPGNFICFLKFLSEIGFNPDTGRLIALEFFEGLGIMPLIAESLKYNSEDLSYYLNMDRLLLLNASVLVKDWKRCLRELGKLLENETIKGLMRKMPVGIMPVFKTEAFMMIFRGLNIEVIVNLIVEKYEALLEEMKIYERYLQTIGIEVEVGGFRRDLFPAEPAAFICSLLGIIPGRDITVPFEYAPLPVRYFGYLGPYFDIFRETGFIPFDNVCSMHVSLPYRKKDEEAMMNGVNILAVVTGLLYLPDERLKQGNVIKNLIGVHMDVIEPSSGKKDLDADKDMRRVELRHLAFRKSDGYHLEAVRAINLLYSCLAAVINKKESERDSIEKKLACVWGEFVAEYNSIMGFFKEELDIRGNAEIVLNNMMNFRRQNEGIVQKLRDLTNEKLSVIEEILEEARHTEKDEQVKINDSSKNAGILKGALSIFMVSGYALFAFVFISNFWNASWYFFLAAVGVVIIAGIFTTLFVLGKKKSWHSVFLAVVYTLSLFVFSGIYYFKDRNLTHDMHMLAYHAYQPFAEGEKPIYIDDLKLQETGHPGVKFGASSGLKVAQIDLRQNIIRSVTDVGGYATADVVHFHNGVAGINGPYGAYGKGGGGGWVVINGKEVRKYNDDIGYSQARVGSGYYEALFIVRKNGNARIAHAVDAREKVEADLDNMRLVIQNGPFIVENGEITPVIRRNLENSLRMNQSAIGVDKNGEVYFFNFSYDNWWAKGGLVGINMLRFAELIAETCRLNGIEGITVISMDWGISTDMYLEPKDEFPGYLGHGDPDSTYFPIIVIPKGTNDTGRDITDREPSRYDLADDTPFDIWTEVSGAHHFRNLYKYVGFPIVKYIRDGSSVFEFYLESATKSLINPDSCYMVSLRPSIPPSHVVGKMEFDIEIEGPADDPRAVLQYISFLTRSGRKDFLLDITEEGRHHCGDDILVNGNHVTILIDGLFDEPQFIRRMELTFDAERFGKIPLIGDFIVRIKNLTFHHARPDNFLTPDQAGKGKKGRRRYSKTKSRKGLKDKAQGAGILLPDAIASVCPEKSFAVPGQTELEKEYEKELARYELMYGFIDHYDSVYVEIRDILDRLLFAAGLDKKEFKFDIIPVEVENAFIFRAKKHIFITTGLLERPLNYKEHKREKQRISEDEIAFILSHEISHVILGHYEDYADPEDRDTGKTKRSLLQKGFEHFFNHELEGAADLRALEIMDTAGFNVEGSISAMLVFEWQSWRILPYGDTLYKAEWMIPDIFKTHPEPTHRLVILRRAVTNRYFKNLGSKPRYFNTAAVRNMCQGRRKRFRDAISAKNLLKPKTKEINSRFWDLVTGARTVREIEELLAIYPYLFYWKYLSSEELHSEITCMYGEECVYYGVETEHPYPVFESININGIALFNKNIININPKEACPESLRGLYEDFSKGYDRIVKKGMGLYLESYGKPEGFSSKMRFWLTFYSYFPNKTGITYLKETWGLLETPDQLLELIAGAPEKEFDLPGYREYVGLGDPLSPAGYESRYDELKYEIVLKGIKILAGKGVFKDISKAVETIRRLIEMESLKIRYAMDVVEPVIQDCVGESYERAGEFMSLLSESGVFGIFSDEKEEDSIRKQFLGIVFDCLPKGNLEKDKKLLEQEMKKFKSRSCIDYIIYYIFKRELSSEAIREFMPLAVEPIGLYIGVYSPGVKIKEEDYWERLEKVLAIDYGKAGFRELFRHFLDYGYKFCTQGLLKLLEDKEPEIPELKDALQNMIRKREGIDLEYVKEKWMELENVIGKFAFQKTKKLKGRLNFREAVDLAREWILMGEELNNALNNIVKEYKPDYGDLQYAIQYYKVEDRDEYANQLMKKARANAQEFGEKANRCMKDYRYYESIEKPDSELKDIPTAIENSPLLEQKVRLCRKVYKARREEFKNKGFTEKRALILEIFPDPSVDRDKLLTKLLAMDGITCQQYQETLGLYYSYFSREKEAVKAYKTIIAEDSGIRSDFNRHLALILGLFPKFTTERDRILEDLINYYALNEEDVRKAIPYLVESETPKAKKEVLTITAIEVTFRQYAGLIDPMMKTELLLWLLKGGEKPYVVKVFESCSCYRLDKIREERDEFSELYQKKFLYEMLGGAKGILTLGGDEGERAKNKFLRALFELVAPGDNRMQLLLEIIFKHIDLNRQIEICTVLSSCKFRELSFEETVKLFLKVFGAVGIKLGQYLATRTKVFKDRPKLRKELLTLTDSADPFAKEEVFKMVRLNIKRYRDFIEIRERCGSASIKQVHSVKIKGKEGEYMVTKVLRPAAARGMLADISALKMIVLDINRRNDMFGIRLPADMVKEIEASLKAELDFDLEKTSQRQLGRNIEKRRSQKTDKEYNIKVVKIMDEYSKGPIITEEGAQGLPIRDYKGDDIGKLKEVIVDELIEEVFLDGFYHADPHPGNIYITDKGTISFIDIGRAGSLSIKNKDLLFGLINTLIVERDKDKLLRLLAEFYLMTPAEDREEINYNELNETADKAIALMAGAIAQVTKGTREEESAFVDAIMDIIFMFSNIGITLPREFYTLLRFLDSISYLLEGSNINIGELILRYMVQHQQDKNEGKISVERVPQEEINEFLSNLSARKDEKPKERIDLYIVAKADKVQQFNAGTEFRNIKDRDTIFTLDRNSIIKPAGRSGFMDKEIRLKKRGTSELVIVRLEDADKTAEYEVFFENTWVPLRVFLPRSTPGVERGCGLSNQKPAGRLRS